MRYTITINQAKAIEWGLNAQQAILFAFVYECPSWARLINNEDGTFFALAKRKVAEELPILTDKPDTIYRMLKSLETIGLILLSSTASITLVQLTDKGREWNKKVDGSEKYPTPMPQTSEKYPTYLGKISEQGSENSPTNKDISNKDTSNKSSLAVVPTEKKKSSTHRSKASRIAHDWILPSAYLDWALNNFPSYSEQHVFLMAEKFKDYWLARAGAAALKADWFATWRNWVRTDAERAQVNNKTKGPDFDDTSWADDLGAL